MDMQNGRMKLQRITKDDDPDRCQGVNALGQCRFKVIPTTQYCPMHGHARVASMRKAAGFKYLLERAEFQTRLDNFASSPAIKSLNEELAILRLMVSGFLKSHNIESVSTAIVELIRTINRLSIDCAKVNSKLASILDAESAIGLAKKILSNLQPLTDEETYNLVYDDICSLVERLHESARSDKETKLLNYKNLAIGQKLQTFMSNDKITSLRNEIAVLRHIITETLNNCKDEADILMKSRRINTLITEVAALIASTTKIEDSLGLLLDKEAAIEYNNELLTIVSRHASPTTLQQLAMVLGQQERSATNEGALDALNTLDSLTEDEDDPDRDDEDD